MGMRHKDLPLEGVQYHPESILTEHGHDLLNNFLKGKAHEHQGSPGHRGGPHRPVHGADAGRDARDHDRRRQRRPDRRLPGRPAHEKRVPGRDHRRRHGDARTGHPGGGGEPPPPGGHRRHRRRRRQPVQRVHRQRLRGRRRRLPGGQARQPLGELEKRLLGPAGGRRHPPGSDPGGNRPVRGRRGRGLHVRPGPPRRHEVRHRSAQGAGHAHPVQHPRADDQPGGVRRLVVGYSPTNCAGPWPR